MKLLHSVQSALLKAGEIECRSKRMKTAKRLAYCAGYKGFRMHWSIGTPTGCPEKPLGFRYAGVGTETSRMEDLRRYEKILTAAGFRVQISGTDLHPSVRRVWVLDPEEPEV